MGSVVDEIAAERRRQVEDYSADDDDLENSRGELAVAAGCYALHAGGRRDLVERWDGAPLGETIPTPHGWPFSAWAWKPSTPRRDLIKAAALIVAEIERLDRANDRSND